MFKLRLFWYNKIKPNLLKGVELAIVIGILIGVGYFLLKGDTVYQYVDLYGNKGVASECYKEEGLLYCKEYYGNNIIQVKQYGELK